MQSYNDAVAQVLDFFETEHRKQQAAELAEKIEQAKGDRWLAGRAASPIAK